MSSARFSPLGRPDTQAITEFRETFIPFPLTGMYSFVPDSRQCKKKKNWKNLNFFQCRIQRIYSGSYLIGHSRKRTALLTTAFTKPRLNSHTNRVYFYIPVSGQFPSAAADNFRVYEWAKTWNEMSFASESCILLNLCLWLNYNIVRTTA